VKQTNIGHHRLHEAEEEAALERLSLFFFLSLSVGKKYTLQEGTFCAVYHSVQQQITLYNQRQHHHLPSKGRERERSEISLARAPRESSSSAPGRDTKQKNLSLLVLFLFVSKTDS
jgi:hypothetical protein